MAQHKYQAIIWVRVTEVTSIVSKRSHRNEVLHSLNETETVSDQSQVFKNGSKELFTATGPKLHSLTISCKLQIMSIVTYPHDIRDGQICLLTMHDQCMGHVWSMCGSWMDYTLLSLGWLDLHAWITHNPPSQHPWFLKESQWCIIIHYHTWFMLDHAWTGMHYHSVHILSCMIMPICPSSQSKDIDMIISASLFHEFVLHVIE